MRKSYIPKTYAKSKNKNRRHSKSRLKVLFEISVLLSAIGGIFYLAYSDTLNIVDIKVNLENENLRQDITSKSQDLIQSQTYWWYNNQNIFLSRTDKLEKYLLAEFPTIQSIQIKRTINRVLEIYTTLRTPIFSICEADMCYVASKDGFNTGLQSETSELVRLNGISPQSPGDNIISDREIKWLATILQEYNKIDSIKITSIDIQQKSSNTIASIYVYTDKGYYIMLDLDTDVLYQAEVLKQVFNSQLPVAQRDNLEYIDLRIKDRAYYKLK